MKILSEAQKGYLAGIFDGEGSIHIGLHKRDESYFLYVDVTNTDMSILNYLLVTTGIGTITPNGNRGAKNKESYSWALYGEVVQPFLEAIFPYLIGKRNRAKIAFEYLETCEESYGRHNPIPTKIQALRHILREELMTLNKRGV